MALCYQMAVGLNKGLCDREREQAEAQLLLVGTSPNTPSACGTWCTCTCATGQGAAQGLQGQVGTQVHQVKGGDTHPRQEEERGAEQHPGSHEERGSQKDRALPLCAQYIFPGEKKKKEMCYYKQAQNCPYNLFYQPDKVLVHYQYE